MLCGCHTTVDKEADTAWKLAACSDTGLLRAEHFSEQAQRARAEALRSAGAPSGALRRLGSGQAPAGHLLKPPDVSMAPLGEAGARAGGRARLLGALQVGPHLDDAVSAVANVLS